MSAEKKAVFEIIVTPKSSRSMVKIQDDLIRVFLHSPPADGKANKECIEVISKTLKIAKGKVSIEKGDRGRNKRISVQGMSMEEVMEKFKK